MTMHTIKISVRLAALLLLPLSAISWANSSESNGNSKAEFTIVFEKPTMVLPQFRGTFRKRESSVSPDEYEMAETLRSLLDEGKNEEALAILNEFYSIEVSVAMVLLKAQIYFQLEMYRKAEIAYLEALDRMPDLVRAHSDLGQLYLFLNKREKAREHFSRAVSLGANDAVIHGQLGFLNMKDHNPWSAINAYQNALTMEPDNPQWQQGLLTALSDAGMEESAFALISEMVNQSPTSIHLWLRKASLYIRLNDIPKALACMEIALRHGESDPANIETAAKMHFQLNNFDRGIELLGSEHLDTKTTFDTQSKLIEWFIFQKMFERANALITELESKVDKNESDIYSQLLTHKGDIALANNNTPMARNYFVEATNYNALNGDVLIKLAELHRIQKEFSKADIYYTRAQTIKSTETKATRGKIRLYIDQLEYEEALALLKQEYRKNPEKSDLKDNIKSIEKIINAESL